MRMKKRLKKSVIQLLSCLIPLKSLRKKFRDRFIHGKMNNNKIVISDVNKNENNNKIIVIDGQGNKKFCESFPNLDVKFLGSNNYIEISESAKILSKTQIICTDNVYVKVGELCKLHLKFYGRISPYAKLIIGDKVTMGDVFFILHDEPGLEVRIGNDCMFSERIVVRPSDGHSIIDYYDERVLNKPEPIIIEEHCWLGRRTTFLKGTHVPKNSVVGANALFTKSSGSLINDGSGGIFAGVPAKLIRAGITWNRLHTYDYEKMRKQEQFQCDSITHI